MIALLTTLSHVVSWLIIDVYNRKIFLSQRGDVGIETRRKRYS
jgi:hypothetical protein